MAIPETRTYARPAAAALAFLMGTWWMFDGILVYVTGTFFGGGPDLWAAIPRVFDAPPEALAPLFIVGGAVWAAAAFGLHFKEPWARPVAMLMAVVTLPYAPVGTLVGLIVLVLLYAERTVPGGASPSDDAGPDAGE